MVFYEAPHKLCQTLIDLADCFGTDRVFPCAGSCPSSMRKFCV